MILPLLASSFLLTRTVNQSITTEGYQNGEKTVKGPRGAESGELRRNPGVQGRGPRVGRRSGVRGGVRTDRDRDSDRDRDRGRRAQGQDPMSREPRGEGPGRVERPRAEKAPLGEAAWMGAGGQGRRRGGGGGCGGLQDQMTNARERACDRIRFPFCCFGLSGIVKCAKGFTDVLFGNPRRRVF